MSKKNEHKTFLSSAKAWALKQKLFGPQAFFRYVIFTFVDCLDLTHSPLASRSDVAPL